VNAGGVVEPVGVQLLDVDGRRSVQERLGADRDRPRAAAAVERPRGEASMRRLLPDEQTG